MRRLIISSILFLLYTTQAVAHWNPWYFEIDCNTYKVEEKNDKVDVYLYNKDTQTYNFFQRLSEYAQKIDYSMEGFGQHYVGVTDESGHLVVYIWDYGDADNPGQFVYWG